MVEYELEEGKGVVEKREVIKKPQRVLEKAMKEAWQKPEMEPVREKLSDIATKYWKPQVEEALATSKYGQELAARAREIKYGKKVEEAWK